MSSRSAPNPRSGGTVALASETDDELRERYRELLEELRTIIPGVQVLFAFLLTAPFSSRFDALDDLGTQVFTLALVAAGVAVAVLLTPAVYHRVTPRQDRRQRLDFAIRLLVVGMVLVAVAIASSVFVVGRLIFSANSVPPADAISPTLIGVVVAATIAGAAVALWFVVPLVRRRRPTSD
jgi:hypothetical protein